MATARNDIDKSSAVARAAWTVTPINYDILANDPQKLSIPGVAAPSEGRPCVEITCTNTNAAGTIVYTGLDGVNVTLQVPTNTQARYPVQAIALVSTSTANNVHVLW